MDHTFHSDTLHEVLSRLETDQEPVSYTHLTLPTIA